MCVVCLFSFVLLFRAIIIGVFHAQVITCKTCFVLFNFFTTMNKGYILSIIVARQSTEIRYTRVRLDINIDGIGFNTKSGSY
jgi:hypothetical protein